MQIQPVDFKAESADSEWVNRLWRKAKQISDGGQKVSGQVDFRNWSRESKTRTYLQAESESHTTN